MRKVSKPHKIFAFFVLSVSVLLIFSVLGAAQDGIKEELTEEYMREKDEPIQGIQEGEDRQSEGADIPTYEVGSYWTYDNNVWASDAEGGGALHFEEEMTYTVESIEYIEHEGETRLCYNISREGDILDGLLEAEQTDFDISSGYIEGYELLRVNDLALVEGRLFRYFEGVGTGIVAPELNGWSWGNTSYETPLDFYDFPVDSGDLFWSNTTEEIEGFNRFVIEDETQENHIDEEETSFRKSNVGTKETIEVPEGEFEAYPIQSEVTGDEEGTQERWYSPEVGRPVKETSSLEGGDMERELKDYDLQENPNELSIEPSAAEVGEEITLSGRFPEHPNEGLTISIPQGGIPESEWETTTDGDGDFEIVIEVPIAEDITEKTDKFSSVGLVAQIEGQQDAYAVSTLSIYHDNGPIFPEPKDGAENVGLDPELKVMVGSDEAMDVTFYDATEDEDTEIGYDESVPGGEYARTIWEDLEAETTYEWYAVAEDGEESYESKTWSFTTVEGSYFAVDILDPPEGENFDEGDEIAVEYEVQNTGVVEDTQDVTFTVYDEDESVYEDGHEGLQLGSEDKHTDSFIWETQGGDAGEYELVVSSQDEEDGVTVNIEEEKVEHDLTISIEGEGTTDPESGTHTYLEGEDVTVIATAAEDWDFEEWTGDAEGAEEEITITMDEDKEITAHFEEESVEYDLTIGIEGEGTTDPSEGTHAYEESEEVSITATPEEGWNFEEWTGDAEGTEEEITITMDEDKEITAHFEEVIEYTLSIAVEGEGTTDPEPGEHTYEEDEEVTLTAIPEENCYLEEWTGDAEGTEEEITITMDGDKEITAHFEGYEPAHFEIEVTDHEENIVEGDTVTIEFSVTNTGELEGTQDIVFSVDGREQDSIEVSLPPDEEYSGGFTWIAEEDGEYELEVGGTEESDIVSVTVEAEDGPTPNDDDPMILVEYWWIIPIVIIVIAAIGFMMKKGDKKSDEDEKKSPPPKKKMKRDSSSKKGSPPPKKKKDAPPKKEYEHPAKQKEKSSEKKVFKHPAKKD